MRNSMQSEIGKKILFIKVYNKVNLDFNKMAHSMRDQLPSPYYVNPRTGTTQKEHENP